MKLCVTIVQNYNTLYIFCILQLQSMASNSSTGIIVISTTKSHAISTKYCFW